MSHTNPFAAAWGPQDFNVSNDWFSNTPPTFGALPTMANVPNSMTFNFIMNHGNILNSSVVGTNSATYFHISTNAATTVVSRRRGERFASIDWQHHPTIEASGIIYHQRTGQWLRLSNDRKRRTVSINGRNYTWIPRGNAICLHGDDTSVSGEIARITRTNTGVTLQLTISAFNSGFFESSVLATILFLSGRNID